MRSPGATPTGSVSTGVKRRAEEAEGAKVPRTKRAKHVKNGDGIVNESGSSAMPGWCDLALTMLQSEEMGPCWSKVVTLWAEFERREQFHSLGNLPAKGRPSCITDWIQCAHLSTYRPSLNLSSFPSVFDAWWHSIQPKWRVLDGQELTKDGVDFEPLRRPGVNGLLSVLAALFFWGVGLGEARGDCALWLAGVQDLTWVLEQLA